MRQYGVSVVSLFPWSLGPKGPEKSVDMALEVGFDGIQVLPLKGWSYKRVRDWEKHVLAYENAWNYGHLWQVPLRHLGVRPKGPTILDWVMFGKEHSTFFPNAVYSAHLMQPGAATEIHPELATDIDEYVNYCQNGGKVCWDTYHVRRNKRDGTLGIQDWRQLLLRLPPSSIELIHVHLVKNEVEKFISGGGDLMEMLVALKRFAPEAIAVIEVAPPLKTPQGTVDFLSKVREQSRKFLG